MVWKKGLTLKDLKAHHLIQKYMVLGNMYIGHIGAIEHNIEHAELTASICYDILDSLGYPRREAELAAIAGYLHDIGNLVNRDGHGMSGAIIGFHLLLELGMDPAEIALVLGAIGNHEEQAEGEAVNNLAAALILADKSDVHRSRVRKEDVAEFTPRDRVNYAVTSSVLIVDPDTRKITLKMEINTEVSSVMGYFDIFLTKMVMCHRAAEHLYCHFELIINDTRLL